LYPPITKDCDASLKKTMNWIITGGRKCRAGFGKEQENNGVDGDENGKKE
jgi:hypothetical protein